MNISLDSEWYGVDGWQAKNNARVQRLFESLGDKWDNVLEQNGDTLDEKVMHPTAVIASNAAASLAVLNGNPSEDERALAEKFVRKFWDTPLREGKRRYYDNCLYMFALLMLSGNYRIW